MLGFYRYFTCFKSIIKDPITIISIYVNINYSGIVEVNWLDKGQPLIEYTIVSSHVYGWIMPSPISHLQLAAICL